jgi:hypothetical protein
VKIVNFEGNCLSPTCTVENQSKTDIFIYQINEIRKYMKVVKTWTAAATAVSRSRNKISYPEYWVRSIFNLPWLYM